MPCNSVKQELPKGQKAIPEMPRFGLSQFSSRFPAESDRIQITISGKVKNNITVETELENLSLTEQYSDFHCVTTWSHQSIHWSGYKFKDFYHQIVQPLAHPDDDATILILKGQDGARTSMLLEDTLAEDVLLVTSMNQEKLPVKHGGPIRLVAPAHYGYKSIKYLNRIELHRDYSLFKPSSFRFMDHPRARVKHEERGKWIPGWILRHLYRPLVGPTIRLFEREYTNYLLLNSHK